MEEIGLLGMEYRKNRIEIEAQEVRVRVFMYAVFCRILRNWYENLPINRIKWHVVRM